MARGVIVGDQVSFLKPSGEQVWIPTGEAEATAKMGVLRPESREEYDRRVGLEAHGDSSAALLEGVLRGGTLGGSDVVLGAVAPEGSLEKRRSASPVTSFVGELGGTLAMPGQVGARLMAKTSSKLARVGIAATEGAAVGGGVGVSNVAMGTQGTDPTISHIAKKAMEGAALGGVFSTAGIGLGALGRKVVKRGQAPAAKKVVAYADEKGRLAKDGGDLSEALQKDPKLQQSYQEFLLARQSREVTRMAHGPDAAKGVKQVAETKPLGPEKIKALEAERHYIRAEVTALRQPRALPAAEREALEESANMAKDRLSGLRNDHSVKKIRYEIEQIDRELARYDKVRAKLSTVKDPKMAARLEKKAAAKMKREAERRAKRAVLLDELEGTGALAEEATLNAQLASIAAKLNPATSALDKARVAARIASQEEKAVRISAQLGDDMAHRSARSTVQGPMMALRAADDNFNIAKENLTRAATEAGFDGGAMPRTGVFVGDIDQATARITDAIGSAQKEVFSFGMPGIAQRLGGMGFYPLMGIGAGISSGSVLGGLGAIAGLKMVERAVQKAVVALGKQGGAESLSRALLGLGRVGSLSTIALLTREEIDTLRLHAEQTTPEQTGQAAFEAYTSGGLDEDTAGRLSEFQARRNAATKMVLNSGTSPASITKGLGVVKDPKVFVAAFATRPVTSMEIKTFAMVTPSVFSQMRMAAKIVLEKKTKVSPTVRKNMVALVTGEVPYLQTTQAMYSVAKQEEQKAQGMIKGRQLQGGRPSESTHLQTIESKGVGNR